MRRLGEARRLDLPQALAVISEAVWCVMMVDATVVRYYPSEVTEAEAQYALARTRRTTGRSRDGPPRDDAGYGSTVAAA